MVKRRRNIPGRAAIFGLIARESQAPQFEFEIALFGYFQRIAGMEAREVIAARKMKPASSLNGVMLVSKRQRANGLQDVEHRLIAESR